jgi:hypothetical protein
MVMTPPDFKQSEVGNTKPMLQDVIAAAKPNLSEAESRGFQELLTEYRNICTMKCDDYGRREYTTV